MTMQFNSFFEEVVVVLLGRSLQNDASDTTTSSAVNNNDDEYTRAEQIALTWTSRIAAIISFISAIYIFRMAWKRRDHVFHRLMLAQSIHLIIWTPWMIYGAAAVPYGTPNTWGAFGNTATCTAQGFFSQLAITIELYYVFLSCYSWVVIIYGNFNPEKYHFIEKYIHGGVHLWPIGSAIYLLYIEAFNPTAAGSRCYIASIPFGCGDESGIDCTRGPQNITLMMWIFGAIPIFFSLMFPTIAMIALAIFVHRRQRLGAVAVPCGITAWSISKQSFVYLGTLYWIIIPTVVHYGLSVISNKKFFVVSLLSSMIIMLRGFWYATVYRYFTISGATVDGTCVGISTQSREQLSTALHTSSKIKEDNKTATTRTSTRTTLSSTMSAIKDSQVLDEDGNSSSSNREDGNTDGDAERDESSQPSSQQQRCQFSFNIFDGTAPVNSRYSAFVFDGDDEDNEYDKDSTKYWAGCQNT